MSSERTHYTLTTSGNLSYSPVGLPTNVSSTPIVTPKPIVGTRFSGADWADQLEQIMLIGAGGIGSWLALNLSRIGHTLFIVDPDVVDETNVLGGQMYNKKSVGTSKVNSITNTCREFGSQNRLVPVQLPYSKDVGMVNIVMTGLDNMKARKEVFEEWIKHVENSKNKQNCILIDGRLLMENMEIITIIGNRTEDIEKYKNEFLFDDTEVPDLDCTTKQSTFGAMIIAGMMTATLCNFLTNKKIAEDFREVPFHQRLYLPIFDYKKS